MNIFGACTRDCFDGCSLLITVRDGKIVSVDGNKSHPVTQGVICQRLKHFSKNTASDQRLLVPMRRSGERGTGEFSVVSWDKAISEISEKIKQAERTGGPSSVALYDSHGNYGLLNRYFPLRFINAINASVSDSTMCSAAGHAALRYNFGKAYGYPAERLPDAKLIVLWGVNSKWTNMHGSMLIQKAKKKGASIWIIDPIRTATAEIGRHLQIRPGTDGALALTLINHIVHNDMHDKEFIKDWTVGFDNLMEIAKKYDINRTSEITGLRTKDITELATEFVSLKPSVIHIGFGLQRQRNGGEMVRAISLLPSIVGEHRGFIYSTGDSGFDWDYLKASHLRTSPEHKYNPLELARLIREGSIKVLFVINSNPLATLPNQNALREVLSKNEVFLVTHDIFRTDTADFSDIILPAATPFESTDIVASYFHECVNINERAIEPLGDSKSNVQLFKALAKGMGLRSKELFEDEDEMIERLLSTNPRLGVTTEALKKSGFCRLRLRRLDQYETPSGKIEMHSEKAVQDGLPGIPDHVSVKGTGHFQLLTPLSNEMNHSSFHAISDGSFQSLLISPEDASSLSIKGGDMVKVSNQHGSVALPVEISDRVQKGVVVSYVGFWPKLSGGANINFVTSDYVQRFGGNSAYNSTFVEIELMEK